jgi:hypothetical protein
MNGDPRQENPSPALAVPDDAPSLGRVLDDILIEGTLGYFNRLNDHQKAEARALTLRLLSGELPGVVR